MMIELIVTHVLYIVVLCVFGFMLVLKNRLLEKYRVLVDQKTELEQSQKRFVNLILELVPSPDKERLIKVMEDTKNLSLEELEEYKKGL